MSYSIRERSAMMALMALNREVANTELNQRYRLGLDKKHRERLNRDGLITSRNEGRSFSHELTDKGWAWAAKELSAPVPARAGSAAGGLYALLNGLSAALERRGMRLADLFGESTIVSVPPSGHERPKADTIPEQIRKAYCHLARCSRDWVYLSELRPLIRGASKAEVDSALKEMFLDKELNLTLEEDQKSLTPAQRAAAIRVGVDDMHLISMELGR